MSFQLILVCLAAAAAFAGVALFRVYRVRTHRDPPSGWLRIVSVAVLLLVPPLVLQVLVAPASGAGRVDAIGAVLLYVVTFAVIWLLMLLGSLLVARLAPRQHRQVLLLAMTGHDTSGIVPFDPPMSAGLTDQAGPGGPPQWDVPARAGVHGPDDTSRIPIHLGRTRRSHADARGRDRRAASPRPGRIRACRRYRHRRARST